MNASPAMSEKDITKTLLGIMATLKFTYCTAIRQQRLPIFATAETQQLKTLSEVVFAITNNT